jgi:xylan 1,4-beta-xylosidase
MRIVNDHHIVTYYWSLDGETWTRHGIRAEASGCHANAMQDLTSLRVALFAAGAGTIRFNSFNYRALP